MLPDPGLGFLVARPRLGGGLVQMLEQVVDGLPVLLVHTDPDTPPGGGANTAGAARPQRLGGPRAGCSSRSRSASRRPESGLALPALARSIGRLWTRLRSWSVRQREPGRASSPPTSQSFHVEFQPLISSGQFRGQRRWSRGAP